MAAKRKKTGFQRLRARTVTHYRKIKRTMGARGAAMVQVAIIQLEDCTKKAWPSTLKEARQMVKQAVAADRLSEADRIKRLEEELERMRREEEAADNVTALPRPA